MVRLSTDELLDLRKNFLVRDTIRRLHAVHVVTPPGSSSPVHPSSPDIRVVMEVLELALEGLNALRVGTGGSLTDDTLLLVILKPLGSRLETLSTNGGADTSLVGTGAVRVEVLVHLVDDLVLRILEVLHGLASAAGDPAVGTSPGVTLDKDVLGGSAGLANGVDGGLVEVGNKRVLHVMVLVVGVEDDILVVGETLSNLGPPGTEVSSAGDDVTVEAAVVVRVNHSVVAPALVR